MKYVKFVINSYKGIPKIELDLSKKPSSNIFTLVGLNESGKTSIMEAIYLNLKLENENIKGKAACLFKRIILKEG